MLINHYIQCKVSGQRYKDVIQKQTNLIDSKELGDENKKLKLLTNKNVKNKNNRKKKNFTEMILLVFNRFHISFMLGYSLFKPQLISKTTWSYINTIKESYCLSFE